MSVQEMREKQIDKKRTMDAMQLSIYNTVKSKENEKEKDQVIEDQIKKEENVIQILQKDIIKQKESLN